jgi:hypothetical protein
MIFISTVSVMFFFGYLYFLFIKFYTDKTIFIKILSFICLFAAHYIYLNNAFDYSDVTESIGQPLLSTYLTSIISHNFSKKSVSSKFKIKHGTSILERDYWVEVKNITNKDVPIYPRFSIFLGNSFVSGQVVFDSSDFEVINRTFKTVEGKRPSLLINKTICLYGVDYKIKNIVIDLIDAFDDYSVASHTKVYEGIDIPYHIQIFLYVDLAS